MPELPILLTIDARIVGAWKRVIEKDRVLLMLEPFRDLTATEHQALNQAVQRYSSFLQRPIILA
jgi:hypothetical protein